MPMPPAMRAMVSVLPVGQAEAVSKRAHDVQTSSRRALRKPPRTLSDHAVEDLDETFLGKDAMKRKRAFEQRLVTLSNLEHEELAGVRRGGDALAPEPQAKGALRHFLLFDKLRILLILGHELIPRKVNAMPARQHSVRSFALRGRRKTCSIRTRCSGWRLQYVPVAILHGSAASG